MNQLFNTVNYFCFSLSGTLAGSMKARLLQPVTTRHLSQVTRHFCHASLLHNLMTALSKRSTSTWGVERWTACPVSFFTGLGVCLSCPSPRFIDLASFGQVAFSSEALEKMRRKGPFTIYARVHVFSRERSCRDLRRGRKRESDLFLVSLR